MKRFEVEHEEIFHFALDFDLKEVAKRLAVYDSPRKEAFSMEIHRGRSKRTIPLLVVVLLISACASTPPDRIAYNSIDAAVSSVQLGMRAFNGLYQEGKATEEQRTQVLEAYKKFQAVALSCVKISQTATATNVDPLILITQAAEEILTLLHVFGVVP